ncbi:MAG: hypothetical protein O3B25_12820 [Verrucomicrobia bacterium]|nr:hypothetical protein [Verrucomicrobiota bacterium]
MMEKKNEKKLSEHPASTPAKAEKSKQSSVAVQKPKQVKKKITEAAVIEQAVESLKVGRLKNFLNMSVAPLVGLAEEKGPEYLTMTEALAGDLLEVTEIDHGGSVPNLKVRNLCEKNVLLLDGEELIGAKQNRVLNTTVLVAGQSEVVVPVSCTEQGRWSYKSDKFMDSKIMMAKVARSSKSNSVSHSLMMQPNSYCSDQGKVWEDIAGYHHDLGSHSSTGAMKAAYDQHEDDLRAYREAFPLVEGQRGVVIFVNGEFSGCEILSRANAYKHVHQKIIESYSLEAFRHKKESSGKPSAKKAKTLLGQISSWKTERFKSVGLGEDLRLQNCDSHGNALLVDESIVHAAAFGHDS